MGESAQPGFYSPDSVTWRIHSDTSMFVGGIRALLEQALHPEAMAGVAAHSNFREDAWGRLQRTGDYVGTLTFGTRDEAEKLAGRVRKVHAMLKLDDQKLLLWVHMAMVDSFPDTALRSGLEKIYPELKKLELTDYKVRILEGRHGTGAVTRVLVETSDGNGEWNTIGVHENVIAASAMALEDAVTYGLLRQGKKPE